MKQPRPNRSGTSAPPPPEEPVHPPDLPAVSFAENAGQGPGQSFAEGALDSIDPDLRHRMISEAAYHLYEKRGYVDGYAMEDWLEAEAALDQLLLNRKTTTTSGA